MHGLNIKDIDLNVLMTLSVLLSEQSVTRAAERLGRSQPAVSHTLAKLRDLFDDALLVPSGRGMRRTPKAEALMIPLERALRLVQGVLMLEHEFEPVNSRRVFTLACSDALGVLLGELLGWFGKEAPLAELEVVAPDPMDFEGALESGRYEVVLAAMPERSTLSLQQSRVGAVQWRTLMRKDHPLGKTPPDLEAWTRYPHVVVRSGSRSRSAVGMALARAGVERRIGLAVPGFLLAPRAVAHTDMLCTVPHIVAEDAVHTLGLVMVEPPIPIPQVHVALMWHERWQDDPGHIWFREGIVRVVRECWG